MNTVPSLTDPALLRLEGMLEESLADRARINRRIRTLRDVIQGVRDGDAVPDLTEMLAASRPPETPPPPAAESGDVPAIRGLGPGLPPGELAAVPPPAAPALDLASVDVGSLARMTPAELDGLPFGVITLDRMGRVLVYNDTESRLAGLPKDRVVGRNFFSEIAPCTRVREFEGRFRDFAEGRSRLALETFEFVFNFRHGAQRVVILISPARHRGQFLVSMIRR